MSYYIYWLGGAEKANLDNDNDVYFSVCEMHAQVKINIYMHDAEET